MWALFWLACNCVVSVFSFTRIARLRSELAEAQADAAFWKKMHAETCTELAQAREFNISHGMK